MKTKRPRRLKRTEPDIWSTWPAKEHRLPPNDVLERLSRGETVETRETTEQQLLLFSAGGRLVPVKTITT